MASAPEPPAAAAGWCALASSVELEARAVILWSTGAETNYGGQCRRINFDLLNKFNRLRCDPPEADGPAPRTTRSTD